tara:strand:- start:3544 stop:3756 length:213 start_codon:yes stop_codon:yes gene_type:complete
MKLAEKNQTTDYKKYIRFLKIFPQYFAELPADFYTDKEIQSVKKFLLDLEIKLHTFDQNKITQRVSGHDF